MALEWLKSVLGAAYTEDIDTKISEEIGKGFVARADFNTLKAAKKDLETQLQTAVETIAGFEAMDIDGIKNEVATYKAAAAQAQRDAEEKLQAAQFDTLLDGAISAGKGRSTAAIRALLDVDALRASNNQNEEVTAALGKVRAEHSYLFDTTPPPMLSAQPYAAGTGTGALAQPGDALTGKMREAAGLKPEKE